MYYILAFRAPLEQPFAKSAALCDMKTEGNHRLFHAHAMLLLLFVMVFVFIQSSQFLVGHSFGRYSQQGWPAVWRQTAEIPHWVKDEESGRYSGPDWSHPDRKVQLSPLAFAYNAALFIGVWLVIAIVAEMFGKRSFSLARLFSLMLAAAMILGLTFGSVKDGFSLPSNLPPSIRP